MTVLSLNSHFANYSSFRFWTFLHFLHFFLTKKFSTRCFIFISTFQVGKLILVPSLYSGDVLGNLEPQFCQNVQQYIHYITLIPVSVSSFKDVEIKRVSLKTFVKKMRNFLRKFEKFLLCEMKKSIFLPFSITKNLK